MYINEVIANFGTLKNLSSRKALNGHTALLKLTLNFRRDACPFAKYECHRQKHCEQLCLV